MNLFPSIYLSVSKRVLLFEAALVWTFAGIMLLFRGDAMLESFSGFSWSKIVACIIGGLVFFRVVFSGISRKHVNRITNLVGDHHHFYDFFNRRSYLMMLGMISMGIFLRKSMIVPPSSLALAYITMGIPLLLSSFRFYNHWYFYKDNSGKQL